MSETTETYQDREGDVHVTRRSWTRDGSVLLAIPPHSLIDGMASMLQGHDEPRALAAWREQEG